MTKKVGLLTLPLHNNYGGNLQAIALYSILKENNFDVVLIRKKTHFKAWKKAILNILSILPGQNYKNVRADALKNKVHSYTINQYITNQTKAVSTTSELRILCQEECLEAVVVGSDQVWRWEYINDGHEMSYFLNFVEKGVKRVAYAASFGKDSVSERLQTDEVIALLSNFDALSLREVSAVEICAEMVGPSGQLALDPTLVANRDLYTKIASASKQIPNDKTVLAYVLDPSREKKEILSKVHGYFEGFALRDLSQRSAGTHDYASIPDWLVFFEKCDFVVTDSYHGMIFSIIFKKQFLVIYNAERGGTRFESLLSLLGIRDRLIDPAQLEIETLCRTTIDYESVNSLLESLRADSLQFLLSALR